MPRPAVVRTAVAALIATAAAAGAAHAAAGDKVDSALQAASGVATRTEKAVERGVKAAASGVERGARAAGSAADRGARKLGVPGAGASSAQP